MLIPVLFLLVLIFAGLLGFALVKKNRAVLMVLGILGWLLSLVSVFFTGWAWLERGYSENWAIYGFIFISIPIIILVSAVALAAIIGARLAKIENTRKIEISFCLLLLFLIMQAAAGFLAAR
jgi:hypothetical protein